MQASCIVRSTQNSQGRALALTQCSGKATPTPSAAQFLVLLLFICLCFIQRQPSTHHAIDSDAPQFVSRPERHTVVGEGVLLAEWQAKGLGADALRRQRLRLCLEPHPVSFPLESVQLCHLSPLSHSHIIEHHLHLLADARRHPPASLGDSHTIQAVHPLPFAH